MKRVLNKPLLITAASFLLMAACSNSSISSTNSQSSSQLSSSKIYNLTSDDVSEDNLMTEGYEACIVRSQVHLLDSQEVKEPLVFETYQQIQDYSAQLKEKSLTTFNGEVFYGNYKDMFEYLDNIEESRFIEQKLILSTELTLYSGSYSHSFRNLYLKDGVLYPYILLNNLKNCNCSITMDMAYEVCAIFINKTIQYDCVKVVVDEL